MTTIADKLEEAGELVANGWCQHTSIDHLYGSRAPLYCALGAIDRVASCDRTAREQMVQCFADAVGLKRRNGSQIAVWNDMETRSQKHVVSAFHYAAELARDLAV